MTNKELLLIDLSSRLPYGVKGTVEIEVSTGDYSIESGHLLFMEEEVDVELLGINKDTEEIEVYPLNKNVDLSEYDYVINDFIQYLRPMSSMTEEEKEEYINIKQGECNGCVLTGKGDPNTEFLLVDFFFVHHFDYRGLIEKGLVHEAPEGMYNIKEQ